jgi:hypothetical protein
MRPKKLQGPCIACKTVADMKYRSVTKLGLSKSNTNKTNTSNLKLGDVLCHNCYMNIVEWDRYEKQKSKSGKNFNKENFNYHMTNQKRVTMSQKNYESLFEKVEELQEHIIQLEAALEQALS